MIYDVYHRTAFEYASLVSFSHNIARLKPKETPFQKLLAFSMQIEPEIYESHEFVDMFGNVNTHLLIREPHRSLAVTGRSKVEISPGSIDAHLATLRASGITYGETLERLASFNAQDVPAKQFLFESERISGATEAMKTYALESFQPGRSLLEAAGEFMERIYTDFEFLPGFSDLTTSVDKTFAAKKGVCQDFAQFAIAALRAIGLPAKYMSGYIETIPPEGKKKLFGADASHAWFALYIPGAGWAEFDPTNNIVPKDQHILLGSGRDYNDISPLKGVVFSSGESKLSVMVDVRPAKTTPPDNPSETPGEEKRTLLKQQAQRDQ